MKIDPDCIRAVLLYLEDNLGLNDDKFITVHVPTLESALGREYGWDNVVYSVLQLHESGYIVSDFKADTTRNYFDLRTVFYITPKGHDFLATIKEKTSWAGKIKPALGVVGGASLSVIESVAKGFATAAIEKATSVGSQT